MHKWLTDQGHGNSRNLVGTGEKSDVLSHMGEHTTIARHNSVVIHTHTHNANFILLTRGIELDKTFHSSVVHLHFTSPGLNTQIWHTFLSCNPRHLTFFRDRFIRKFVGPANFLKIILWIWCNNVVPSLTQPHIILTSRWLNHTRNTFYCNCNPWKHWTCSSTQNEWNSHPHHAPVMAIKSSLARDLGKRPIKIVDSPKPKSGSKAKAPARSSAGSKMKAKGPGSAKEDSTLSNHKAASSSTAVDSSDTGARPAENGGDEHTDDISNSPVDQVQENQVKLLQVLSGNLEDLPPLSSKIVRIFTSSTFTGE